MKMRLLIAYFFLLFSCVSVFASEKDALNVYYSVNQSFVDIVDSISCVQKKLNIKNSFQKQDFYVFFTRKSDGVFMYITHCRLFEDEYGSKYVPFGCVVKNDSFFYLVKDENVGSEIESLFHKTANIMYPQLVSRQSERYEKKSDEPIFFAFRQSKLFKFENGVFCGAVPK